MSLRISRPKSRSDDLAAIPSVDWWVTSRCTLTCDFCYGPRPTVDPVRLRDAICDAIRTSPTPVVTFCGGEPLLVKKIFDYARIQRVAGKSTVLNTNGELLVRRFGRRHDVPFDVVGISIDGPDASTHRLMRGAEADFDATYGAARWLAEQPFAGKRKIATVISAVNRDRIDDLAWMVRDLAPDVWRLYQYSPWGPQNYGQARHRISDAAFAEIAARAAEMAAPVRVRASSASSTGGCFIVDPSGRILQTLGDGYEAVGNCLDEPVEDIWRRLPQQSVITSNKRWLQTI